MEDTEEFWLPGLSGQLYRNIYQFKRMKLLDRLLEVHHGEFLTMSVLSCETLMRNREGMCVSELAKILKNTPAASSRMLTILEDKGYIERFFDKKDRRNTYVRLTKLGTDTIQREYGRIRAYVIELQRRMGEENCRKLLQLQQQTLDITEQYLKELEDRKSQEKEDVETC